MIEHRVGRDGKLRHRARVYRPGGKRERGPWRTVERQAKRDEARLCATAPRSDETVASYAAQFLNDYERRHKQSSYDVAKRAIDAFVKDFGQRPLDSISRQEAKRQRVRERKSATTRSSRCSNPPAPGHRRRARATSALFCTGPARPHSTRHVFCSVGVRSRT